MTKQITTILLIIFLAASGLARAANQDACAGWLCMPFGYALPGCSDARSEAVKRMLEGKSPLPSFSSCSVDGKNDTSLNLRTGQASLGGGIKIGLFCNHRDSGAEEPAGCVRTLVTYQVTEDGAALGQMYLRDKEGPDWTYDRATREFTRLSN